jgi:hypothetical protein
MKKSTSVLSYVLVLGAIILSGFAAAGAQDKGFYRTDLAADFRPFDFSNKFYEENGVDPALIVGRRSGDDKLSVFDFTRDERFRSVRITGTFPAYDRDGKILFFNHYGDLFEESFVRNDKGARAQALANRYPIFAFPSQTGQTFDRQAVVIETDAAYFEKNALGLSVYVDVEYTDKVNSEEGRTVLEELAKKNGLSADGTPIIRTIKELNDLTRRGLVKQTIRGTLDKSRPAFAVARVIEHPQKSAIAPDAFLLYVARPGTTKPLPAEEFFLDNFECLQRQNTFCSAK